MCPTARGEPFVVFPPPSGPRRGLARSALWVRIACACARTFIRATTRRSASAATRSAQPRDDGACAEHRRVAAIAGGARPDPYPLLQELE